MTQTNEKFLFSVVKDDKERKKLPLLSQYAFFPSPDDTKRQETVFEYLKDAFILSVYDKSIPDSLPIATATSIPMTQNLRGKIFPMDGVASVATEPSYRRQRVTASMMKIILEHDKEQKTPISTLYPFKESFYAKFGYITLPQARIATLQFSSLSPLLSDKTPFRSEKMNYKENFQQFYEFALQIQKQTHGFALKSLNALRLNAENRPSHLTFVYDENNAKIGCIVYTTKGYHSDMLVSTFLYLNSKGKYLLFRFLALHVDQFSTLKFPLSPTEHPENWFNDLQIQISNREWAPAAMARIVDIMSLQDLPVGVGSLTIKINDKTCSWNAGIFQLNSTSGKLSIAKISSDKFECELTIEGLTALVYGNYILDDFLFKNWITLSSTETLKKLALLFPPQLPHIYDTF